MALANADGTLIVLAATQGALHEAKLSPRTLVEFGLAPYEPVLLGRGPGVPCWAAPEPQVPDGAVVVQAWVLHHLGVLEGEPVSVSAAGPASPPLSELSLCDASDMAVVGADDGDIPPRAVRLIRRQLVGLPLRTGAACAVQWLDRVRVLTVRSQRWLAEEAPTVEDSRALGLVTARTALRLASSSSSSSATPPAATSSALHPAASDDLAEDAHGDALLRRLQEHVAPRLLHASAAQGSGGAGRWSALGAGGDHVLLCGPSGCGKTHAMHRLAAWAQGAGGVTIRHVRLAQVLAAEPAAAATLRGAFAEAARHRVVLLLLHGLDLLCGAPGAAAASEPPRDGVAFRVASLLLSHLRAAPAGLLAVGGVQQPRSLPAGLRSHGGFETTMALPPPTAGQRRRLVRSMLELDGLSGGGDDGGGGGRGRGGGGGGGGGDRGGGSSAGAGGDDESHSSSLEARLAEQTGGFTTGDLRSLLRAAAAHASLRRATSGADGPAVTAPPLCWRDCEAAMLQMTPSGRGEFGAPLPTSRWADVGGYEEQRERLQRLVQWPHAHAAGAQQPQQPPRRLAIEPPSGALLYGPPGNGKTLIVQALARSCGCAVLSAKGSQLFGEYVGDTEAAIRALFRQAREAAPSVVFIDEMDAIGAKREAASDAAGGGGGGGSVAERALSTLLNEVDGVGEAASGAAAAAERPFVFLLGCSNRPEMIDAALLRPGRMEQLIYVPPPDEAQRRAVLAVHAAALPLAAPLDLDGLAKRTARFSCAALAALVREAALRALARHMPHLGQGDLGDGWRDGDGDDDGDDDDDDGGGGGGGGRGGGAAAAFEGQPSHPSDHEEPLVTAADFDEALTFVERQVLPPAQFDAMVARYAAMVSPAP